MNQRRGEQEEAWTNRRVRVPARSATGAPQVGMRPHPIETEAPIPLLDTNQEAFRPENGPRTIDINLNVPALPKLPIRKVVARIGSTVRKHPKLTIAILAVGLGGYFFWPFSGNAPLTKGGPLVGKVKTEKIEQKPEYNTVLPTGKSVTDLGGWARVSPPSSDPVFAYADMVDGVKINVSQQPIPGAWKTEGSSAVENLAKGFNATEKVTAGNITAYIGTSAQGPQSVIFTKDNLLILIKSSNKLTADQWVGYISSLQ